MNDEREVFSHCESCSKPIYDGDSYHTGADVDLCADCAPDYADLLASYEHFTGTEGEPLTQDEAKEIYDAHIAAGGSPNDKIGIRS